MDSNRKRIELGIVCNHCKIIKNIQIDARYIIRTEFCSSSQPSLSESQFLDLTPLLYIFKQEKF